MMEQRLRTIEVQLDHAVLVAETALAELRLFQFHECSDTLAQLKGELQWIRDKAKDAIKEVQP